MSDPLKSADIEDVLSSIRRLVSEDTRPIRRESQDEAADRLVLTPALRVPETDPLTARVDAGDAANTDTDTDADADAPKAGALAPEAFQAEQFVFEDSATPQKSEAEATPETDQADEINDQADGAPDMAQEHDHATEQVDDQAEALVTEGEADYANVSVEDRVAEIAAMVDAQPDLQHEEQDESLTADDTDHDDAPEEAAQPDLSEQVAQDAATEAHDELEKAAPAEDAEAHAMEWEDAEQDEPLADAVPQFVHTPASETVSGPLSLEQPVVPEPEPEHAAVTPDDMTAAAPDDGPLDLLSASDDAFIDEEALREMVAEIVRQELQGALGERITRNVRKLVRREIHRALSAQDFE